MYQPDLPIIYSSIYNIQFGQHKYFSLNSWHCTQCSSQYSLNCLDFVCITALRSISADPQYELARTEFIDYIVLLLRFSHVEVSSPSMRFDFEHDNS